MNSNITMVLTSCDRFDLLKITLESFIEAADIYPQETIIIEDGPRPKPEWLTYPQLGDIKWLQNEEQMGQVYAIDKAYALINTDYIFHCEDDWKFTKHANFIAYSKQILDNYPEVFMVTLRYQEPLVRDDPRFPFFICEPGWREGWNGFSWNPGLRRLYDYKKIGSSYEKHLTDYKPSNESVEYEKQLSNIHLKMGYVVADIGFGYVVHIGEKRHVK